MSAALFRLTQGGKGIRRLTGLAYRYAQVSRTHYRVTIPVFAGTRDSGLFFKNIFCRNSDVPRTAAGNHMNPAYPADILVSQAQLRYINAHIPYARRECVFDGLGLFGYLLFHKMVIAALFRRLGVPVNVENILLNFSLLAVIKFDTVFFQQRYLPVTQQPAFSCISEYGRNIRRKEIFVFPPADYKRTVFFRGHNLIRSVSHKHRYGIGAAHISHDCRHGLNRIAVIIKVKKMGKHLCIGLRDKDAALFRKL